MRSALHIAVLLLVVTAGCSMLGGPDSGATETSAPTEFPEAEFGDSGVACHEHLWVSFWGLNGPQEEQFWEPDVARVGYDVPANTSFFVVAYVDGSVAGVRHEEALASGSTVDGATIDLGQNHSGYHTVEVVLHHDGNDDGEFQREADPPCVDDGEPVSTGSLVLNFSEFA